MIRYGINRWSYPRDLDVVEALRHAAKTGYNGFEVAVYQEDVDAMGSNEFNEKWKRIAEEARSLGIEIPSVATGLFWRYNMVLDDQIDNVIRVFETECRVAQIVGAKVVLVVPGVAVPSIGYEEHIRKVANVIKRLARIARDYGVVIGLENVWNRLFAGPLEFLKLLEEVGEDNVGTYFDVGNTLPHSLPEHWIRVLDKRIVQVHVKDFNVAELRFGIPLTGDVNWAEVKKALNDIGYDGYIVAEVPPYRGDPFKAAEDTLTSLKKIFG